MNYSQAGLYSFAVTFTVRSDTARASEVAVEEFTKSCLVIDLLIALLGSTIVFTLGYEEEAPMWGYCEASNGESEL